MTNEKVAMLVHVNKNVRKYAKLTALLAETTLSDLVEEALKTVTANEEIKLKLKDVIESLIERICVDMP